jgi:uncharacterized protein (TIGR02452 family)
MNNDVTLPSESEINNPCNYPAVSVVNTTTFAAAREIIKKQRESFATTVSEQETTKMKAATDVCCLNFASAKNPGGGFLKGSQAQEESLARASGLYSCLLKAPTYYQSNRSKRNAMYEDLIIYSPDVPVFRNDNDELLEDPWKTAIITAPAPNRGVLIQNNRKLSKTKMREFESLIQEVFEARIDMVLATAMNYNHRHIVLGAWGTGVFKNDPRIVANLFKNALMKECFKGAFDTIVFAVLDTTKDCATFNAFEEVFINFPDRETKKHG